MAQDEEARLKAEAETQADKQPNTSDPPQPNEEPQPVAEEQRRKWSAPALAGGIVIGGIALLVLSSALTHTSGATRSAKLRLEQRQHLIEQAAQARQDAAAARGPLADE